MADKKISDFTEATSAADDDFLELENVGGNSRKIKKKNLISGYGSSFPGSPSSGDRYFRSDLNMEFFYNGTRWLSSQLFFNHIAHEDGTNPRTITLAYASRIGNPHRGVHDLWIEKAIVHAFQTSATTASNYYSIAVIKTRTVADGGDTTIATVSTQSLAQNDWILLSTTINALAGINTAGFAFSATRTGTQTCFIVAQVQYRLVGV